MFVDVLIIDQIYTIARELLYSEIAAADDLYEWCNEIAVVGGVLIDDYGFVGIFVTTAIMQLASTFPIMWIAGLVPMEEG